MFSSGNIFDQLIDCSTYIWFLSKILLSTSFVFFSYMSYICVVVSETVGTIKFVFDRGASMDSLRMVSHGGLEGGVILVQACTIVQCSVDHNIACSVL